LDESSKKRGKEVMAFKVEGQRIPLFGSVALQNFEFLSKRRKVQIGII
jgi:hypothetical protein